MYNEQQQKEIAEMAEFIHGRHDKNGSLKTAQALYDKGYRKVDEKTRQYLECIPEMKKAFDKVAAEAVKKFAQKIKDGVADYLYKTNFDGRKDNVVDMFELCEIIDELLKEYEK